MQTHISFVFLTGERVYKFRKPVELPFLDFGSVRSRTEDCLREVSLNRRLAEDVYLGIAPLVVVDGRVEIGRAGESYVEVGGSLLEHCVVMRRLPSGRDALALLDAGGLTERMIEATATRVAEFHQEHCLGRPAPFERQDWLKRVTAPVEANFESLASASADLIVPAGLLEEARSHAHEWIARHADVIEARRGAGRAVDGHGDLHLEHIWFEDDDAEPLIVDCVEFNESLRRIDPASDVAFVAMDLAYRGHEDLAERFLRHYASARGDYDLYRIVDYFVSYRALVRAKVAALTAQDEAIGQPQRDAAAGSAVRHLRLGVEALRHKAAGSLVAMCGSIGTGKSTVANALADELGATLISSDRLRKHLAGLAPSRRLSSDSGEGAYSPAARDDVYRQLTRLAMDIVATGRTVVLDATFSSRRWRDLLAESAGERGVSVFLVEARAQESVARRRLVEREYSGNDPSDAGIDLLETSLREFEKPDEWPADQRFEILTDQDGWKAALVSIRERVQARRGS